MLEIGKSQHARIYVDDKDFDTFREIIGLAHRGLHSMDERQLSGSPLRARGHLKGHDLINAENMLEALIEKLGVSVPETESFNYTAMLMEIFLPAKKESQR